MSQYVEVKTAELVGAALDWAVGKCSGMPLFTMGDDWPGNYSVTVMSGEHPVLILDLTNRMWLEHQGVTVPWLPSTIWAQGGPLIDQYQIELLQRYGPGILKYWYAFFQPNSRKYMKGDTALMAICRAVVAANLGDVVQVPVELAGVDK